MTNKQEIDFWKKAVKLLKKQYGKPCKDFNISCPICQAYLVISWIENHADVLEIYT